MFTFQLLLQLAEAIENGNTTELDIPFLIAKAVEYKKQNLLFDYLLSYYPPFQKLRQHLVSYENEISASRIQTASHEDVHDAGKTHSYARLTAEKFLKEYYLSENSPQTLSITQALEKSEIQKNSRVKSYLRDKVLFIDSHADTESPWYPIIKQAITYHFEANASDALMGVLHEAALNNSCIRGLGDRLLESVFVISGQDACSPDANYARSILDSFVNGPSCNIFFENILLSCALLEAHISDASLIEHMSEDTILYIGDDVISKHVADHRNAFVHYLTMQFTGNTDLKNHLANDFDKLTHLASQMTSQIRKTTLKQVIDKNLSEDEKTQIAAQQAKARQVLSAERELGGLTKEAWIKEKTARTAEIHAQQLSESHSKTALSQMFPDKQIPSHLMDALHEHPDFTAKEDALPSYTIRFSEHGAQKEIPIEKFIEDYIEQSTLIKTFLETKKFPSAQTTLEINALPNNASNAKESLLGHLRSTPKVLEFNPQETEIKIQQKKEEQVQQALAYIDAWSKQEPSELQVFHLSDHRILKKLLSLMTRDSQPYAIYYFSLDILEALYHYLQEENDPINKQLFIFLSIALKKEIGLLEQTTEKIRNTYILIASRYGNIDVLKQISPQHWATPQYLATAAIGGHHQIVDLILDEPTLQMEGYTAYPLLLKRLIEEANTQDALVIIHHYTVKNIPLAPDDVQALLFQAICLKNFPVFSELLNYLLTVKKETEETWNTPAFREQWLHAILKSNSSNTLEFFWAMELLSTEEIMHFAENKGLLDQAIRQGKEDIAKTLLFPRRSLLFLEHNNDKNVLRLVIQCQRTETVKKLLEQKEVQTLLKNHPKRYKKLAIQHSSWETLSHILADHNPIETTISELEDIIKKKAPLEVVKKFLSHLPKDEKIPLKLLHIAMEHSAYKSVVEILLQRADIQDQIKKITDKKLHLKLLNAALREYLSALEHLLANAPINEHSVIAAAKENDFTKLNIFLNNKNWSTKVQAEILTAAASQCNAEIIFYLLDYFSEGLTPKAKTHALYAAYSQEAPNRAVIDHLLEEPIDPEYAPNEKPSLLSLVVNADDVERLEKLLRKKIQKTALHNSFLAAIREGKSKTTPLLFNAIHEKNFFDEELYTSALCLSIEKHDQETFHALMEKINALSQKEQKTILNGTSKLGWRETPLLAAIRAQNSLAFKYLLDKKTVSITVRVNILHLALDQSSTEYLDDILAKIELLDFDKNEREGLFYPEDSSPLTHALRLGKTDSVIKLLEAGVVPKGGEDFESLRKIICPEQPDSSVKILQLLRRNCSSGTFKWFVDHEHRGLPLLSEAIYYSTELNNPIANELLRDNQDPNLIDFSSRPLSPFCEKNIRWKNCIIFAIEKGNHLLLDKILKKAYKRGYPGEFRELINSYTYDEKSAIEIALENPHRAACFSILLAYNPCLLRGKVCHRAAAQFCQNNSAPLLALLDKLEHTEERPGLDEKSKQELLDGRLDGRSVLDILAGFLPPTDPVLARLIRQGADPDDLLLYKLCVANQRETLRSFKEKCRGFFKHRINARNGYDCESPLIAVARCGHDELLLELLEEGADPLSVSVWRGADSALSMLIKRNAEPALIEKFLAALTPKQRDTLLQIENNDGLTPVMLAENKPEILHILRTSRQLSPASESNSSTALMNLYAQREDTLFRGARAVEARREISHNPRTRIQI